MKKLEISQIIENVLANGAITKREILYYGITNLKHPYILSEHKLPL